MYRLLLLLATTILLSSLLNSQASLNSSLLAQKDDSATNYNEIWGYSTATGEEYAIIGTRTEIYIYDVTTCDDPVQVFTFIGGENNTWRDFKTFGNYVYGVCDSCNEGLHIFDLSALPTGPVVHVNTLTTFFGSAHNIFIDEPNERLYAVGVPGSVDITVLDLSVDPANPTLLQNITLDVDVPLNTCSPCYVHDVYVKDHIAYASHGWEELYSVYDLTDLANPIFLNDVFMSNGYNHSSWPDEDEKYSYVAIEVPSGVPMNIVDLSNLDNPFNNLSVVGTFQDPVTVTNPTPHNPFVRGDYLYISYYGDGLKIYDITNRTNPVQIAYYDTDPFNASGAWGTYPYLDSGCLLVSDMTNGLHTIQANPGITDTCTPVISRTGTEPTVTHSASNYLTSDAVVPVNSNTTYQAEQYIDLLPGFEVAKGLFEAKIEACVPNN